MITKMKSFFNLEPSDRETVKAFAVGAGFTTLIAITAHGVMKLVDTLID
jgi:hypothetical protein